MEAVLFADESADDVVGPGGRVGDVSRREVVLAVVWKIQAEAA